MNLVCLFFYLFLFELYTEIQNGHQNWRENDFWEKSPVDSANNLRVKNFMEITLSRSISEINTFLCFTQKLKMAAKSCRKTIFQKITSRLCRHPVGQKFRRNHYLTPFPRQTGFCVLRRN